MYLFIFFGMVEYLAWYDICFVINRITMSMNIGNIGSTVKKAKGLVSGALSSARGVLGITDTRAESDGEGGNVRIVYPSDIRGQKDHVPLIEFTAYERNPTPGQDELGVKKPGTGFHQIWLPIGSNIAFSDAASYGTANFSSNTAKAAQQLTEGGQTFKEFLSSVGKTLKDSGKYIGASSTPGALGDYAAFTQKTISNPNTNTTFEGNGIRTFSFNFKLIAKSQEDSRLIQKIHETFRYFTYADLATADANFFLSYPAPWTIRFLDSDLKENEYIPGIWSCYLTSVNSSFNSSSNMYFTDNAPLEVDIALTFQETRVLNRNDMMQIKSSVTRGIDKVSGNASSISPPSAAADKNVGGDNAN
jgi:hypothetical protein